MTHQALGAGVERGGSVGLVETRSVRLFTEERPFVLASGETLGPLDVAYETYGTLAPDASNAFVVCHALTGDAHAAGHHGDPEHVGWWDTMIGPGKPVDTNRLFVVSSNLLGGCKGTTGPSSPDPRSDRPYGLRFPLTTMSDLVEVQRALLRHLGVRRLQGAIGGSLGGMQVLQWELDHPGEIDDAVLVCASARLTAQNIALSAVARASIMKDEHWAGGDYYGSGSRPDVGLSVARMLAHITYVSEEALQTKFGREQRGDGRPTFGIDFEVESYLEHQGQKFLERFDANTYLYLSRVMDYFDPFADEAAAIRRLLDSRTRWLLVSFDSDWRFPTSHSTQIARVLRAAGRDVTHREISSPWGHDSFLLPVAEYLDLVDDFLGGR
ncbi:MAG: homoserine O-acetyltransferase [Actinobacteria bacterium]|nr:homoserine O-acetyltransferase [Actinomycetota bacterium]